MHAQTPTLKGMCLVICTLVTDCSRALTFTPSSTILIRVLQFVLPHLVRKLLQSSSNPPSKSRDHELMKPLQRKWRCVCVCMCVFAASLSLSLFAFLSLFPDLSCLTLFNSTCVFLDEYLMGLSVLCMVDHSLSLNIIMLTNVHDLISQLAVLSLSVWFSSIWSVQLRTYLLFRLCPH